MIEKLLEYKRLFLLLFIICLVSIEFLATTTVTIGVVESMWDKSNHFIAFFTLYVLLSLAFINMSIFIKSFYLLLFAVQIEVVQRFIDERCFSLMDIVADSVGIAVGILVYKFIYSYYHKI